MTGGFCSPQRCKTAHTADHVMLTVGGKVCSFIKHDTVCDHPGLQILFTRGSSLDVFFFCSANCQLHTGQRLLPAEIIRRLEHCCGFSVSSRNDSNLEQLFESNLKES